MRAAPRPCRSARAAPASSARSPLQGRRRRGLWQPRGGGVAVSYRRESDGLSRAGGTQIVSECVFCVVVRELERGEVYRTPSGGAYRKIRDLPASIAILGGDQFYRGY